MTDTVTINGVEYAPDEVAALKAENEQLKAERDAKQWYPIQDEADIEALRLHIKKLEAENERLINALADASDQIKEQETHIESLQNTVAQVTAENVALGEYVDADMEAQNTIKKLEAENERLRKDAERYRWVREYIVPYYMQKYCHWPDLGPIPEDEDIAEYVDRMVDEAMKDG